MTAPPLPAPAGAPMSRTRQLAAASVGNLVEWYDWYAYSFLAVYFSSQFFPEGGGPLVPLLNTFAIFAVGFFMRPVGGLLLGWFADRFGRRSALTLTITLMGAGGLLLAVSPTYAQVGVLAPILLVLARLIQGLSVGGEFAASTTFLVESAGPGRRGLFSSFQYVSTTTGQLAAAGLAALMASQLSKADMEAWGWRVVFLVGAVASIVGLWIRKGAHETHPDAQALREGTVKRPHMFSFLTRYPGKSLLIIGITVAGTISYYTWTVYLPSYAETSVKYDPSKALLVSTIALAFFIVLQPLAGMLSDRIGRKPMLLTFSAGLAILTVPLLNAVDTSFISLLSVSLVAMVFLSGYTAIAAAVMVEIFPARVRAAGIGFPYSLTVALFGGTAPYVGTYLSSLELGSWFPWYIVVLTLVSLPVYFFLRETKDDELDVG
ncbi:MFS transporter [Stackebrandtia nassauensis]|uniref:Putative proline/betaine transporter n=1 Tax=Stackebrandtia nassauensis (strain DSM 44728 / CIP 108903 / NRRL B-16338 / NBRC 102104 / LLR-40K-21) TaxID=446470 RepID=D3PXH9_STANL|nr:MFS transporter [Stackebrandtia nassauensis]ADD41442.1 major facilitator superfamily MFS_1 [Stackebrandtia nassauensis DSM 44728]